MPPKVRDLVKAYKKAGFIFIKGGKGSHRKLRHPTGVTAIVSGKENVDAKAYQEKDLKEKIKEAIERSKRDKNETS